MDRTMVERVAMAVWDGRILPGGPGRTLMPWPLCPEADWCRAVARAAIETMGTWMPMNSVPKDGRYFLVTAAGWECPETATWELSNRDDPTTGYLAQAQHTAFPLTSEPTHWRELPEMLPARTTEAA